MSAEAGERWSPYPGLRPFQPDDSEYFYGRDLQVDEVVARLRDKRFVAVIGGSGSGKSSLVLAGAIPRLRTFAIKDAGDFWAPVVATPGTNHVEGDSPIRRLARKFCGELVAVPDAPARLEACAELLRQPHGLGQLVERFGDQLKGLNNVSLDRLQVNFLILLDQFEELFHPSNVRDPIAADCRHLVDRIVEQFKQPHRQVCVALTMRSEHLNDCPRYEALPDAINAASYLVKRLDDEQLRNAIEQPVLRYLRKHVAEQRSARRTARQQGIELPTAAPPPEQIPIEPALIERLLSDSRAVLAEQDHADHLPLLQHLLFWVWHAASARCAAVPLVDALTLADLWQAVAPLPDGAAPPLADGVNTLEKCLENRCEAIFLSHVDEQDLWEAAFRSLAFKEPNTGTYTQQRAAMAELRLRLGMASVVEVTNNDALAAHLQPWLQPHGYLHWDVDSGTVKVAHETLIRRWQRFRRWVDEEDRQFHVYLRLLEDCERWNDAKRSDWVLSGGDTLRRYEDEQLPTALRDPARVARITRLLGMDRDGQRLAAVAGDALHFLDLSLASRHRREAEREQAEAQKRQDAEQFAQVQRDNEVERAKNAELLARTEAEQARNAALVQRTAAEREKSLRIRWRLWLALMAVFALIPLLTWSTSVWFSEKALATKERTLHRSYALAAESQVGFQPQFKDLQGPQGLLRYALIGAYFFDVGRSQQARPADWPLLRNYYHERLDALQNTERFSEARNAASLRTILQGGVWQLAGAGRVNGSADALACATVRLGDSGSDVPISKAFFIKRPDGADGRGLVLSVGAVKADGQVGFSSVSVGRHESGGHCFIERTLLTTPPLQPASVGIASDASNVVIAFKGYAQFHTVVWDSPTGVYARPRATVASDLPAAFHDGPLPTKRASFWTDVALGGVTARLFNAEPSVLDAAALAGGQPFTKLMSPMPADAPCAGFVKTHDIDLGTDAVWQLQPRAGRAYCLRVSTIKVAQSDNSPGMTVHSASLYAAGAVAHEKEKDLPLLGQQALGDRPPTEFMLDERAGWLAFRSEAGAWRAVPFSLEAFRAQAGTVFSSQDTLLAGLGEQVAVAPAAKAPAASGNPAACGRGTDDPQFDLPYNLILGDMVCPADAALKQGLVARH